MYDHASGGRINDLIFTGIATFNALPSEEAKKDVSWLTLCSKCASYNCLRLLQNRQEFVYLTASFTLPPSPPPVIHKNQLINSNMHVITQPQTDILILCMFIAQKFSHGQCID